MIIIFVSVILALAILVSQVGNLREALLASHLPP